MLQSMNNGGAVNVAKEIKIFKKKQSNDNIRMDFEDLEMSQMDEGSKKKLVN